MNIEKIKTEIHRLKMRRKFIENLERMVEVANEELKNAEQGDEFEFKIRVTWNEIYTEGSRENKK